MSRRTVGRGSSKLIIDKPGAERLLGKGHLAELAGQDQIVLAHVIAVGWADVAPAQAGSKSGSMAAGGKFVGLAAE